MANPLTDRQREIKELLDQNLGAREIAEELGISRNAVYQQLQRLRNAGALPPGFTPTGAPPREAPPGAAALKRLLGNNHSDGDRIDADIARASTVALLHEIRRVREELNIIVYRLSDLLPR